MLNHPLARRILRWLEIAGCVGIVVGLMVLGALRDAPSFWAGIWVMGSGLVGLWAIALVSHLRNGDKDRTIMIGCAMTIPLCLLTPYLAFAVPILRVVAAVAGPPTALTVDQLLAQRPRLPLYVRLSGRLDGELAMHGEYTRSSGKSSKSRIAYCRTPLLDSGWRAGAAVPVITSACPAQFDDATIEGILYPISPSPAELGPPRGLINDGGDIKLDNAPFQYDPASAFYLDARSPGRIVLVFVGLPLGLVAAIGALAWLAARQGRNKSRPGAHDRAG